MTARLESVFFVVCVCVVFTGPVSAGRDPYPVAKMVVSGSDVWFDPVVPNAGLILKVAGPDGAVQESRFAAGETPFFTPGQLEGLYQYELLVVSVPVKRVEGASALAGACPVQTGSFRLLNGEILSQASSNVSEMSAITEGMLETFSGLTIQADNARIYLDDTSALGGFAANDWTLVANDFGSGGASYFGIEDETGGTMPFRVNAGAPDNALFVASNGYVGAGTATPQQKFHMRDDDTPAISFEQTGSMFPPQTWDLRANEVSFLLRDATASTSPFVIRPGAPTAAIELTSQGYLGLGLSGAQRQLHLRGPNATFRMDRSANTAAFILCRVDNAGNVWKSYIVGTDGFGVNNGQFIISDSGTGAGGASVNRMVIQNDGTVVFGGNVFANSFSPLSSIAFKTNVRTLESAMDLVSRLRGVRFDWKSTGKPSLGLIAEEVEQVIPEVVAQDENNQMKALNYSSLVAVLVEAVKSQKRTIDKQQEDLTNLKEKVARREGLLQGK